MAIALSLLGVAFAAFCVWLTVRIFNRRERWAKWTMVGLVVVFIAYPLGFGLATWLVTEMLDRDPDPQRVNARWDAYTLIYGPMLQMEADGPQPIRGMIAWSMRFWFPIT
jgi:hypothetical protein